MSRKYCILHPCLQIRSTRHTPEHSGRRAMSLTFYRRFCAHCLLCCWCGVRSRSWRPACHRTCHPTAVPSGHELDQGHRRCGSEGGQILRHISCNCSWCGIWNQHGALQGGRRCSLGRRRYYCRRPSSEKSPSWLREATFR